MSRGNAGKKRGAQPRQSGGGGGKRWPFFVGGLLLGLLLSGGVYLLKILPTALELRDREKAAEQACADGAATPATKPADAAAAKAAGEKPVQFEFYSMLPKQEVVAPVNGNKTTTATPVPPPSPNAVPPTGAAAAVPPAPTTATAPVATPPPPKAEPKPSGRFQLQAGSFRTRPEADKRRAALVLSGLNVGVVGITNAKGENWYRVMVGPFATEAEMQKARQQLAGLKVDTIPVKGK